MCSRTDDPTQHDALAPGDRVDFDCYGPVEVVRQTGPNLYEVRTQRGVTYDASRDELSEQRELLAARRNIVRMELAVDHARGLHNPPAFGCDGCESAIVPGRGDGSLRLGDQRLTQNDAKTFTVIRYVKESMEVSAADEAEAEEVASEEPIGFWMRDIKETTVIEQRANGSLPPVHPLEALTDPTIPHPFEGCTDRWCTLPGCDKPYDAKVHTDYIVADEAAARLRGGAHV